MRVCALMGIQEMEEIALVKNKKLYTVLVDINF